MLLFLLICAAVFMPSQAFNRIRLEQNIAPLKYTIFIKTNLDETDFEGRVVIDLMNWAYYNYLTLNGKDLTVEEVVCRRGNEVVQVTDTNIDTYSDRITFAFAEELYIGEYTLDIKYKGKIRSDMNGYYRSYYHSGDKKKWFGSTQFQTHHARTAFPCFDEPKFRSQFEMFFSVPTGYEVVTNGKKKQVCSVGGFTHHFSHFPTMPTYLLAWIIYETFTFGPSTVKIQDGIEFKVYSQKIYHNQITDAMELSPKILKAFGDFTGILYTRDSIVAKMDQVGVPEFEAGAMENWALVTYREPIILRHPQISSADNFREMALVISHEFSHQWFGNLVTTEFWSYTWLNEGVTSFFEFFITNKVCAEWKLEDRFGPDVMHLALQVDYERSHPLTTELHSEWDISKMFDTITYKKGSCIVRMMEQILTPKLFQKGIQTYLNVLLENGQTTTPDDFLKLMTSAQPRESRKQLSLETAIRGWTERPGYPLITVKRNYSQKTMTIEQVRFTKKGLWKKTFVKPWYVPLTYTTKDNPNFVNANVALWLTPEHPKLEKGVAAGPSSWVIFNIQQKGYYRVQYDITNWNMIINQLIDNHDAIGVMNRAQLLNDSFHLAENDMLKYDTFLGMARYLSKEREHAPWLAAKAVFDKILQNIHGNKFYRIYFQSFLIDLVSPLVSHLGLEDTLSDDLPKKAFRETILTLAAKVGHKDTIEHAKKVAEDLASETPQIKCTSATVALLCEGVRRSNHRVWLSIFEKFKNSKYTTQILDYGSALACTENKDSLYEFLKFIVKRDTIIRNQDIYAFQGPLVSTNTQIINFFRVLKEHTEELRKIEEQHKAPREASRFKGIAYYASVTDEDTLENIDKSFDVDIKRLRSDLASVRNRNRQIEYYFKPSNIIVRGFYAFGDWVKSGWYNMRLF